VILELREPALWYARLLLTVAAAMWAVVLVLGAGAWLGAVGIGVVLLWNEVWERRARGGWSRRRALAAVVRGGAPPGPRQRAAVEQSAREYIAGRGRHWWLSGAVLGGFSAACLVAAVWLGRPAFVVPWAVLLVLAVLDVLVVRRAVDLAHRWLTEPSEEAA
jgi:4-hydroxybenzoate polyprenyltransferase